VNLCGLINVFKQKHPFLNYGLFRHAPCVVRLLRGGVCRKLTLSNTDGSCVLALANPYANDNATLTGSQIQTGGFAIFRLPYNHINNGFEYIMLI